MRIISWRIESAGTENPVATLTLSEAHLASQSSPQASQVFSSWDLNGAKPGGVIVQKLDIEELKSSLAQSFDQVNQGDFRGVALARKHRLSGEQAAYGDAINAAN